MVEFRGSNSDLFTFLWRVPKWVKGNIIVMCLGLRQVLIYVTYVLRVLMSDMSIVPTSQVKTQS